MGQQYIIDSNAVIDFLNGKLLANSRKFMAAVAPVISVITQIELLSSKNIPAEEWKQLEAFIAVASIHTLNNNIVQQTISLRQQYKLKTPDAIIAATALVYDSILITRNTNDFKKIEILQLLNPWDIT